MFDDSHDSAAPERAVCGQHTQVDPATRQPTPCKGYMFEIYHGGQAQNNVVTFHTRCLQCNASDTIPVVAQTQLNNELGVAQSYPQLVQQGVHPATLVCPCGNHRFQLQDQGNEYFASCPNCRTRRQVGFLAQKQH